MADSEREHCEDMHIEGDAARSARRAGVMQGHGYSADWLLLASLAISAKRIADALEKANEVVVDHVEGPTREEQVNTILDRAATALEKLAGELADPEWGIPATMRRAQQG